MEIETEETLKHAVDCKIRIVMTIDHQGIKTEMKSTACSNTMMVAIANLEVLKLKIIDDLKKLRQDG